LRAAVGAALATLRFATDWDSLLRFWPAAPC